MTDTVAHGRPRARSRGRRRTTPAEVGIVWAVVAAAALGGALAGCEPTGSAVADVALTAGLAATVTYFASRARRWSWLFIAGVAAAGSQEAAALAFGLAALAVAFVAAVIDRRSRLVGAVVGALAVQALLRLPAWEPFGVSAVVAAIPMMAVVVSGYRASRSDVRRRALVAGGLLTGFAVVASVAAAVVVVSQRGEVNQAVDTAREALRAAEEGDVDRAEQLLAVAGDQFDTTNEQLSGPLTWGGRVVPVVGQHVDALDTATAAGADLTVTAASDLRDADVEQLRFQDGVIDLDLVTAYQAPLRTSSEELARTRDDLADVRTPWLVPPVTDRLESILDELDAAAEDASVASEVVDLVPALFGGEGPRRYGLLFTTPAEMRGLDGFIGQYGELTAVDGDVELTRHGRIVELRPPSPEEPYAIAGPQDYLDAYGRFEPGYYIQDLSFSPDFPSVAEVYEQIYPQTPGGGDLDGVIVVDPIALAGLIELSGPVQVPGLDQPLTGDNAADFLLRGQYLEFDQGNEDRREFLDDVTRITFEQLTSADLPSPRRVIDVLGPLVREGRLAVHATRPDEQALFDRLGLDGAQPPPADDLLSVTTQNSGNSKIDIYLRREIDYRVTYDPATGAVDATMAITLRNDAPAEGQPRYVIGNNSDLPNGTNAMYLSAYTPWNLLGATVGGLPFPMQAREELGVNAYSNFVQVAPGQSVTIELDLSGSRSPGVDYDLVVAPQPMVNPDLVTVTLAGSDGWTVCEPGQLEPAGGGAVSRSAEVGEDTLIEARFCES